MYYFASGQSTNTLKLAAFFLKFQTEESTLKVNESQITIENTFNLDHFQIKGNYGSNKPEKYFFWEFLQVCG